MWFKDIIDFLLNTFNLLYNTTADVFSFLNESITIGENEFSIGLSLFGAGFFLWIIYKAFPAT